MKLRKFFGLTSRSVLDQVRAELGPDAVIVANRPTPDGIEITAVAGDAMDTILATRERTASIAKTAEPVAPPPAIAPAPVNPPNAEIRNWSPPRVSTTTTSAAANSGFSIGAEPPATVAMP